MSGYVTIDESHPASTLCCRDSEIERHGRRPLSRPGGGDQKDLSAGVPFDFCQEIPVGLGCPRGSVGERRCRSRIVIGNRAEAWHIENAGEVRGSGDRPPDQPHDSGHECGDDGRGENSSIRVPCDETEDEHDNARDNREDVRRREQVTPPGYVCGTHGFPPRSDMDGLDDTSRSR